MGKYEVVVPKLGESVIEATITRWLKQEGEMIQEDEPLVEIATDKVDSEITAPVGGMLSSKVFKEGDIVAVGAVFAILDIAGETPVAVQETAPAAAAPAAPAETAGKSKVEEEREHVNHFEEASSGTRFYSPLVKSIARQENIPFAELDNIKGTGKDDRLTKHDILNYVKERNLRPASAPPPPPAETSKPAPVHHGSPAPAPVIIPLPETQQQVIPGNDRIVEMDRIRQLIASHMVKSVQTSPHVTSFMEADMTRIVQWREKNKDAFQKRENAKLTFTPVFIEAIAKAVRDFPMVNVSLDGSKIIIHKSINVGMAVAMPNLNLIVPVVRNADEKNLLGLVKNVNDLAERARIGKLVPDEITGGTISLTNLGSFGTLMGTPIINQPQTAIVAVGAIKKRPVVLETPDGDVIAIRPIMMISVTYDHRVIDGALGGQFLARVVQYLENFDANQPI
jgi:2-oxoglutarate dehydrogenase E2 component (dihydrolipoamide succinyltransferase)